MKNKIQHQSRFQPHCFDMFVDCWENLIPGNKITFIMCTRIEIASFEHEINSHPSNVFCAVLISFYRMAIRISVYEYELIIDDGIKRNFYKDLIVVIAFWCWVSAVFFRLIV